MIISLAAAVMIAQATPAPATGPATAASPAPAASAAPAASPAAATAEDPAITARAKDLMQQFQTGKVDRTQLDAKANAALSDSTISQASTQLAKLGAPTAFALTQKQVQGTTTIYLYKVTFPSMTLNEIFVLDADGKVGGIVFRQ